MAFTYKARYDKIDPYVGGHRAPLAADFLADDGNKVIAVGFNANGALVKGAGQDGVIGVLIVPIGLDLLQRPLPPPIAGTEVDYMAHGEIANFLPTTGNYEPGKKYYAAANGDITTTDTGVLIGVTAFGVGNGVGPTYPAGGRLIVHVQADK